MTTQATPAGTPPSEVRIRMYRQGLGDCFLLRFPREEPDADTFNILIDCGLITVAKGAKAKMQKVVADLAAETKSRLDVVVMTHEHWDHVSGFSVQQTQALFDTFTIGEVWYAWTEDRSNALGKKLRAERAAKLETLQKAAFGIGALGASDKEAGQRASCMRSLLRFFGVGAQDETQLGADGAVPHIGKTRAAFEYLLGRSDVQNRFLHPKNDPLSLPGVPGVRVFVLGPPEDEGMIKRSAPTKKGHEVYEFAGDLAKDANLGAAFERLAMTPADAATAAISDDDGPFDAALRRGFTPPLQSSAALDSLVKDTWQDSTKAWRRIDADWTMAAEELALDLDNHTNNTCLALAFELSPGGKVLLFPADAQVGNWLSWQQVRWQIKEGSATREVTGPQLLGQTVFYKVGHHGSHNATLRELGLEQMTSPDLVAFLPVFAEQARSSGWKEMPFEPLVGRLAESTKGRMVFSDDERGAPDAKALHKLPDAQRQRFLADLHIDTLYYEYRIAF